MENDQGEAGLRSLVAANLAAMMRESRSLRTIEAVEAKTAQNGSKVGKSTVSRLLRAETPITLDKLASLAAAFGVEPWRILSPIGAFSGPAPEEWSDHARELARLCDHDLDPDDRPGLLSIAISSVGLIKAKRAQALAVAQAVADLEPESQPQTAARRH